MGFSARFTILLLAFCALSVKAFAEDSDSTKGQLPPLDKVTHITLRDFYYQWSQLVQGSDDFVVSSSPDAMPLDALERRLPITRDGSNCYVDLTLESFPNEDSLGKALTALSDMRIDVYNRTASMCNVRVNVLDLPRLDSLPTLLSIRGSGLVAEGTFGSTERASLGEYSQVKTPQNSKKKAPKTADDDH